MKILIADDDLTSRTVLAGVLKRSGYDIVETIDGVEAWGQLREPDAPKLAILDWVMPGMDGIEVLQQVRSLETDNPPYIIMLTVRGGKTDIIAGLDAGANDYLSKPFDVGELRARIEVGRRMIEMQEALLASRELLAHQATHDALTGLLNRRAILDTLHRELARAERQGGSLAAGLCDIDHFKTINDTCGHQTGDDVLCELSQIISRSLREYDSVGRLGGEEFLVLTPIEPGISPLTLFERIRARVADAVIATRTGDQSITMSIGVASSVERKSVDDILAAADEALYRAKNQGRNRVMFV